MNSTKKIFHLEDEQNWIDIVQKALKGYEVYSARSIEDAINIYPSQEFDLAILDISLVKGDSQDDRGENFMKALEGLNLLPGKRIIILSAYMTGLMNQERIRKYFKFYKVLDAIPKQKFDSKELKKIIDDELNPEA